MPEFVPSSDALDRLGRKFFPSAWIGEEHMARRGLISKDDWSRIKDLPPACGAGRLRKAAAADQRPQASDDPSDPLYQAEYEAPGFCSVCPLRRLLLQVDGFIMPGLVELCTPHLVYALMLGSAESYRCPEPNVEVVEIFQSPD